MLADHGAHAGGCVAVEEDRVAEAGLAVPCVGKLGAVVDLGDDGGGHLRRHRLGELDEAGGHGQGVGDRRRRGSAGGVSAVIHRTSRSLPATSAAPFVGV